MSGDAAQHSNCVYTGTHDALLDRSRTLPLSAVAVVVPNDNFSSTATAALPSPTISWPQRRSGEGDSPEQRRLQRLLLPATTADSERSSPDRPRDSQRPA
jgi:hypothetical protein